MAIKICPKCKTSNEIKAELCVKCHFPLRGVVVSVEKAESQPSSEPQEKESGQKEFVRICQFCLKEIPYGKTCDCNKQQQKENSCSYYLADFSGLFKIDICNNRELVLGRDGCGKEFFVNKLYVSRRHLSVFQKDDKIIVTDLSSKNGTLLNGKAIKPDVPVSVYEGDRITLGAKEDQDAISNAVYFVLKKK